MTSGPVRRTPRPVRVGPTVGQMELAVRAVVCTQMAKAGIILGDVTLRYVT